MYIYIFVYVYTKSQLCVLLKICIPKVRLSLPEENQIYKKKTGLLAVTAVEASHQFLFPVPLSRLLLYSNCVL